MSNVVAGSIVGSIAGSSIAWKPQNDITNEMISYGGILCIGTFVHQGLLQRRSL